MKVDCVKSLWGMSGSLEDDLNQIVTAGYDGVEFDLPDDRGIASLLSVCDQYPLKRFAVIRTSGPDYLASFEQLLERAATLGPSLVTSHSAMDSMPLPEALRFFEGALAIQSRLGLRVAHETHRQTALFTPWQTATILSYLPDLKITADYSHWCCVAERMLDDQNDAISACCKHVVHIHGRVGFPGGPQVGDPRAPENLSYLQRHEQWWTQILRSRLGASATTISFDPEYGPPPTYMPVIPYSQSPVADLWDVCTWATDRFREMAANLLSA